jgi:ABC-type glutathione transport system ATPase component
MTTLDDKSPMKVRERFTKLSAWQEQANHDLTTVTSELEQTRKYLSLSEKVTKALEILCQRLFREVLDLIEAKLSVALQEVLDQPIVLKGEVQWRRSAATVDFWVERNGNREDILKGQGGSVTNVLSVGLRMFALTTLDEAKHRRFLVLDEQDCWLRPDLVPKLVKIVHEAGKALGFQVLMISHHDVSAFSRYADRVYQFTPSVDNEVHVALVETESVKADPE